MKWFSDSENLIFFYKYEKNKTEMAQAKTQNSFILIFLL